MKLYMNINIKLLILSFWIVSIYNLYLGNFYNNKIIGILESITITNEKKNKLKCPYNCYDINKHIFKLNNSFNCINVCEDSFNIFRIHEIYKYDNQYKYNNQYNQFCVIKNDYKYNNLADVLHASNQYIIGSNKYIYTYSLLDYQCSDDITLVFYNIKGVLYMINCILLLYYLTIL